MSSLSVSNTARELSAEPAASARTPESARRTATTTRGPSLFGVAVVLSIVLVQLANQYLSGHELARVLRHMCFLAIELPVVLGSMGLTYAYLQKRQVGATAAVGVTVMVAGALGAACGVGLALVSIRFPEVLLRPMKNFTMARGALYGFSLAQFHLGLWALAFAYPRAIDEARTRDLETEQLRSAAELARLRAHLEPHFLLNTLNAIAGLVTEEPREARRLIGCLGDLLREALHDDDELQTLHAQVAWLQRYAAILQARHAGALSFEWDIAPGAGGVLLPRLLLQPLVENAVKHGALQRTGGGKVLVRVRWATDDLFECAVEDNGPGAPPGDVRPGAFGLRAIVRRVELKYPGAKVTLAPIGSAGGDGQEGTRAVIEIPRMALETASALAAPAGQPA